MQHEIRPRSARQSGITWLVYLGSISIVAGSAALASYVQRGFGTVQVSNVMYENATGIPVRAKLYRPLGATPSNRAPGVVLIHGYQNNRETSDPFCIELARRGFVSMCIDTIGRGNSGLPLPFDAPGFDSTYGAAASVGYLKGLDFVDPLRIGIIGNSIGGSIAYEVALKDPDVRALVVTGFAFDDRATFTAPKNMLMIFGKYDEFRELMTHAEDVSREWLKSETVRRVIPAAAPAEGVTYGDFGAGTARRVVIPSATHLQVPHSKAPISASLEWMKQALTPDEGHWMDPMDQIWPIKEGATLLFLIAGLFSAMPLGLLLLRIPFFSSITQEVSYRYVCDRKGYLRATVVNGLLMWLYIPLSAVIVGFHLYILHIDRIFPMMVVNTIVWWFVVINLIGFWLFLRWRRKRLTETGITLRDVGLSEASDGFSLSPAFVAKVSLLGLALAAATYLTEHIVERLWIVDMRFIFPFASDLTWDRTMMIPRYFPFLLLGFAQLGIFLHVQLRRPARRTWWGTWLDGSFWNTFSLVSPLVLFLMVQYLPLFALNTVPFLGPGGAFASFILNLFQLIGVLMLIVPISTWFFQVTGSPWVGAIFSASVVTWMLTSSQVIAPIPI